ncbi:Alpha/Beta hydrolase protein [Suillus subaureus]|uniref:Alpha/Beta hydrolase protein n=1 Tax=Suillus subaureus TaxID=48587 RepID=A0A9P7EL76_9AGAM|nr:Alpha/Beta hydrolase protein [Suillus subaureus]KAG1824895.1 Alpha/Beta hydrolase protein [Suillus subaureus]
MLTIKHPFVSSPANYNKRPFYAFRARGSESGHPFFTSMDELVSCYAAAVKRTQATGPYAIVGYGYRGVVAFEVTKQLEVMGEGVKFVVPTNIPSHIADRMHEIDWTSIYPGWINNRLKAWSDFSRGEPSYIEVPGEHYTLMNFDHIPQFQGIFRHHLKARGQ